MHKRIMLIGEAWGAEEAKRRLPFCGASGRLLNMLLRDVGITGGRWMQDDPTDKETRWIDWTASPDVYVTNCFNLRPPNSNNIANLCGTKKEGIPGLPSVLAGKYIRAEYTQELIRLRKEIETVDPNIVVALGGTALICLTAERLPITKNRGAPITLPFVRKDGTPFTVIGTFHPAAVAREWSHRPLALADLAKAEKLSHSRTFTRPSRKIWLAPAIADLHRFEALHFPDWNSPCAIDIETAGGFITEIGFAPDPGHAIVIPFYSREKPEGAYWETPEQERQALNIIRRWLRLLRRPVFQNGLYDLAWIWRCWGTTIPHAGEDTMLLQHSLQPEMQKGLGFLGSIYTEEPPWKLMRQAETLKTED